MSEQITGLEMALTECIPGETVVVQSVDADSQLAVRLRELGIVPGAQMVVRQSGQPMPLHHQLAPCHTLLCAFPVRRFYRWSLLWIKSHRLPCRNRHSQSRLPWQ